MPNHYYPHLFGQYQPVQPLMQPQMGFAGQMQMQPQQVGQAMGSQAMGSQPVPGPPMMPLQDDDAEESSCLVGGCLCAARIVYSPLSFLEVFGFVF